jgi:hypothetical protein
MKRFLPHTTTEVSMTYRTIIASALLACSSFGVGVAAQSAPPTGELGFDHLSYVRERAAQTFPHG